MAAVYTEDAVFLPLDAEPLRGQAAIERFWHGGIRMGIRGLELEILQLEHERVFAYEIGRYTLCFEPEDDAPVTDLATRVVVHRRQQDGSWRRAVEIFNRTPPAPDQRIKRRR
jgi:ketosteroid isomerase-like protein